MKHCHVPSNRKRFCLLWLACLAVLFAWIAPRLAADSPAVAQVPERPAPDDERPLLMWSAPGYGGVDFPVHVARIAVGRPDLAVVAVARSAPGDANKALTMLPVALAKEGGLLLAVNANAFDEGGVLEKLLAEPGRAVGLSGVAITGGHVFEGAFDRYAASLWVTPDGGIAIRMPDEAEPLDLQGVSNAVTGFHQLIRGGEILDWGAPVGPSAERMARSAAGVSADGRWLFLVVTEGRGGLFSKEGFSEAELARLMADLGCAEALMLDCGGSSALVGDLGEGLRLLNRPEKNKPRPVPVLLGVRLTASGD